MCIRALAPTHTHTYTRAHLARSARRAAGIAAILARRVNLVAAESDSSDSEWSD